ncbi:MULTISPECIES: dTDP-4-dehydrorhamnose reductase [unclassified Halomonas]|uniref:dTDP-4-dehydrorhamnose reductase n=1 Tax=unclassified Halomonas TaxID=2609666 RepID=UPI0020A14E52|nr:MULTISPECIES: dTDP-4-dehydrorhamnose reductase [unclassified Halomonas]MCP1314297.1 dTDP-4-dehydrorhamnose reductase [Halomonas sp. 707D7]MCP1326342.1 dTDP-4-dehydrorhamnose reductase [Halomonas sp. 707D4]
MKILITGGNGQVGFELQRQLATSGETFAPTRRELDLADPAAVSAYLERQQFDVIVNAAAYTAVDNAESDEATATRLNASLPGQLAAYCAANNALLIHYSSDYVYTGDGETPWRESDPVGPCNVYGDTKLAGDESVMESGCRHVIFRTSWVYSAFGKSFLGTMLRLGGERESLNIIDDQIGAPTPSRLIALVTQQALAKWLGSEGSDLESGVYHLAPRGHTSWHGFAREIFEQARKHGMALAVRDDRIGAIPTSEYPTPATRPLNSRLNVGKIEQALGITMPDWQSQVALTVQEIASSR